MTQNDWNTCADVGSMLAFASGRASERKLRLFSCACCRRVWHLMSDARHRRVVEAAECFADGPQQEEDFAHAMQAVSALWALIPDRHEGDVITRYMTSATRHLEGATAAPWAASFAARGLACLAGAEGAPRWNAARRAEEEMQCRLLRDIIGDPSRPFQFDAAWLAGPGATAVAQARAIYDKGRFADLPSLAETLERAGCHNSAVLDHCREPSIHIRGCWVVDALLGRESAVRFGLMTETDWHTCGDPKPLLHILRDKGSNRKWRLFAVACCRRINRLIVDEPSRRAVEVAMRYADGEATEAEVEAARTAAYQAVEEAGRAEDDAEAEANFDMTPEDAAACCRSSAARAAWATLAADTRVSAAEPDSFEARRWCPSDDSAAYACGKNVYVSMEMVQSGDAANAAEAAERTAHCDLLRDLFGDAFGPPGEEGSWLDFGSHLLFPENRPEQWRLLPTRRNTVLHRECLLWSEGRVRKLTQAIYDENAFDRLPILADAFRVAERFAEGQATVEELEMAHEAAGEAAGDAEEPQERDAAHAAEAASDPSEHLGILTSDYAMDAAGHLVRQAQHSLLLELLGPPFRPVDINPAWLTWNYGTVQKIAQAISDERAFDRMPILADALEEASCANQDILTHCRQPGEHVRGCWAVDLILGRP